MITKTIIKETKELVRDGRIRFVFAMVLFLMVIAIWIGSQQYKSINEQYENATASERTNWDGQGKKNPHSAAHYGTYAFKPKYPLSLLDQGVDKYVGTSILLEAHNRNEAQFSAAADQTGLARFGDLTPDFILLFIIPLLIILLGYNSITKEYEMGTFTLLKSQGISFRKLILGKWIALFIPIALITFILFLVAGIILYNLQDFGSFEWSALLWMFIVYIVYYGVFINITLLISAKVKKSGIALVVALAFWILACLGAPKAASNIAEGEYPFPSRQEFASRIAKDKKEGLDGHNPWNKEAKELREKVLKEYQVDSLHKLPFNFDAYRMQKGEEHQAEIYFKHYSALKKQFTNQTGIYKKLAMLSPYLPTRFLSMSIAHTDYATHWDFSNAAENYRIKMQEFLNANFANNSKYGEWNYQADADVWKKLPPFQYSTPKIGAVLDQNSSNIWIMIVWLLGSFGLLLFTTKTR